VSQSAPASVGTAQEHNSAAEEKEDKTMPMRDGTSERREQLYREAIDLIARDYSRDLQLEGVARTLATSRRQLQRAFAEVGNTSFRDELAKVRMHHARELLAADGIPVRTVAASVGYHQPAQFAKSFRRHHGEAPSTFRKQRRSNGLTQASVAA
jgi:transcriptional regulator GlxA family with amidase domain